MRTRLTRISLAAILVAAVIASSDAVRGEDPPVPSDRAHVQVKLPVPDAVVVFGKSTTTSVGPDRLFETPTLKKGTDYTYEVTATWKEEGKEHKDVRIITINAGKKIVVDFTKPEEKPKDKDAVPKDKDAPVKDKDTPPKDKDDPVKDKDTPSKDKDTPSKDKDTPPKDKDVPLKDKDFPPKDKDFPPKDKDFPPKDKDIPLKDKDFPEKDVPLKDKDLPEKDAPDKDTPDKDKDGPAFLESRRPLLVPVPER